MGWIIGLLVLILVALIVLAIGVWNGLSVLDQHLTFLRNEQIRDLHRISNAVADFHETSRRQIEKRQAEERKWRDPDYG